MFWLNDDVFEYVCIWSDRTLNEWIRLMNKIWFDNIEWYKILFDIAFFCVKHVPFKRNTTFETLFLIVCLTFGTRFSLSKFMLVFFSGWRKRSWLHWFLSIIRRSLFLSRFSVHISVVDGNFVPNKYDQVFFTLFYGQILRHFNINIMLKIN